MKKLLLLVFALILAACAPSEAAIQTAISQTQAAYPTDTVVPTKEPTQTFTPTLTSTPTLTKTITPTRTPAPTKTNTPTPTNTATLEPPATLTQQAKNAFATATADSKTATAQVKAATATEMASYISIPRKELITYAEKYTGTKAYVEGRVFTIQGNVIQIYFAGTSDVLYVNLLEPASGIYKNDAITVYGYVQGNACFTNRLGGQTCQPALAAAWYPEQLKAHTTPTFTLTPTATSTTTKTPSPTQSPTPEENFPKSDVLHPDDLPIGYSYGQSSDTLPLMFGTVPKSKYTLYQEIEYAKKPAGGVAILMYSTKSAADTSYNYVKSGMEGTAAADITGVGEKAYATSYNTTSQGGVKGTELIFLQCNIVIHIQLIGTDDFNAIVAYGTRIFLWLMFFVCQ